ncbi:hypothetical protein ABT097_25505 [Streptomyces sp. NPDC002225]
MACIVNTIDRKHFLIRSESFEPDWDERFTLARPSVDAMQSGPERGRG